MTINGHGKDNIFLDFAEDYDRMIDWEKRLKREEPFFRELFSGSGAASVLDAACGTGKHAIMFRSWGMQAAGADVSREMIRKARENARKEGLEIDFRISGLEELDSVFSARFDAVTCMGNSLPHIKNQEGLSRAFSAVCRVLEDGGIFALQMRNYRRTYDINERFMPLNTYQDEGREYLYLRMNDLGPELVNFNIITLVRDEGGKWSYRVESEELKPWMSEDIEMNLRRTGFTVSGIFGDLAFGPFNPAGSVDLVITARKK
ncbi:MAG: hypothetical protein CVU89_02595 [Firmicutes bacterium HGW-Firmicutes-14]|nr:MAG: hypothetical protein CVU89_02595 [Firmicutes bacterium HGW-Firmicutes-14]